MSSGPARKVLIYRNCDVERVVAIIPEGHKHLRLIIEFRDQTIVLQEATVAAIVRAYVSTVAHPTRRSIELVMREFKPGEVKDGYALCQLIETPTPEEELERKWREVCSTSSQP